MSLELRFILVLNQCQMIHNLVQGEHFTQVEHCGHFVFQLASFQFWSSYGQYYLTRFHSIQNKAFCCGTRGNNKPIRFQIFQLSRSFNKHSQRDCIECQSLNSLQLKIILHHSKRKRFLEPKQATLVLRPLLMNYTSPHPHRSNLQRETKWTNSPLKFEEEAGTQGHLDGRVPWP